MATRIEMNNAPADFVTAELLGFAVGGGADDGSCLLVVGVMGLPALAAVRFVDREEMDAAIEAMQAARIEAFGK